jgi:hypothetical protein
MKGRIMKITDVPHGGSYEAVLTQEQRIGLHALLLSDMTLAEACAEAPPWPDGGEKAGPSSKSSLARIRSRLRIEGRLGRIEAVTATARAAKSILKKLVTGPDQEQVLDQAMNLIGQQVIEATLGMDCATVKSNAAWMLLRRADQRRSDRRSALFSAQAAKGRLTDH